MEEEKLRNRANELDDMVSTTGQAMLGLTLACARCHDHKYDPLPTRDYYRLMRVFNSGDRAEVPLASQAEVKAQRAATGEVAAGIRRGGEGARCVAEEGARAVCGFTCARPRLRSCGSRTTRRSC